MTTTFQVGFAAGKSGAPSTSNPFIAGTTKLGAPKFSDFDEGSAWAAGWQSAQPARVAGKAELAAAASVEVSRFRRKANRCYE
jgi:hypothetical protein